MLKQQSENMNQNVEKDNQMMNKKFLLLLNQTNELAFANMLSLLEEWYSVKVMEREQEEQELDLFDLVDHNTPGPIFHLLRSRLNMKACSNM